MSIVRKFSIKYLIISGEHKGRVCMTHETGREEDGFITIIFDDENSNNLGVVKKGEISSLDTPGWPDSMPNNYYDLKEYIEKQKGNGSCMLRHSIYAQPRALKKGDVIVTGETVLEEPRRGYNSSVLIHLDRTGWVELAARLPIALEGNKKSRLPFELVKGNRLITECLVSKNPISNNVDWTEIFLDHHIDNGIKTPSCIPLAME